MMQLTEQMNQFEFQIFTLVIKLKMRLNTSKRYTSAMYCDGEDVDLNTSKKKKIHKIEVKIFLIA